ncbi:MAG: D-aminoacyl-tRNA deacylase [Thermoplasmata archaeon]
MDRTYLVISSGEDPVASRVTERWGTPESTGWVVEGVPVRRLGANSLLLRRPALHIRDERLDLRLPLELRERGITLVFPSIHRSEQNVECLTVHPLGNPGPTAEVGGRPRLLVPTDPRRMAATLRRLAEGGAPLGFSATYEATHHGPEVELPAFFVEIGFGTANAPPDAAVRLLADVLPDIVPDPADRIALAIGGGHYAPHFTDLALRRSWAFGHLISRHALAGLDAATARSAWGQTVGAEGVLYARAEDAKLPALAEIGPRLRDGAAPSRREALAPTGASRPASGT